MNAPEKLLRVPQGRRLALLCLFSFYVHLTSVGADSAASGDEAVHSIEALARRATRSGERQSIFEPGLTRPTSLLLHASMASNDALALAANIQTLQRIEIQAMPSDYHPGVGYTFDRNGIAALQQLTNLTSLAIACAGPLAPGTFQEICKLPRLEQITLLAACPPVE